MKFAEMFERAMGDGRKPYPYQVALAETESLPQLMSVPTGLGKTAAGVLGWLYRRRFATKSMQRDTPRRLVYCLPMRTLVEQTVKAVKGWLENLGLTNEVAVHLLMGGEEITDWDNHPEKDAILVGTQDMLLSRALNRGYGMSRYRWPVHFGLLNNDCLWVMDETQLMGVGLTTSAQLQGLRQKLKTYGVTHSLWMSATLDTNPINTVDHKTPMDGFAKLSLTNEDKKHRQVAQRLQAQKALHKCKVGLNAESDKKGYAKEIASLIQQEHKDKTLTLVVVNRVPRAQAIMAELKKLQTAKTKPLSAELALVHARYRPCDREVQQARLVSAAMPDEGRIVVATQAIEAGVDVSATTLFTELAPWPSVVQRLGRCNRYGECSNDARVFLINTTFKDEKDKLALPYSVNEMEKSRKLLSKLDDVGPDSLSKVEYQAPASVVHTIRRKDLLDLWDTTPDLSGNDLDVSRFIRDSEDTDVQFFWRKWEGDVPSNELSAPTREELCSVGIGRARDFLEKHKKNKDFAWSWNSLDKAWCKVDPNELRSGMALLLNASMGGYDDAAGWTGDVSDKPTIYEVKELTIPLAGMDEDDLGAVPLSLSQHLQDVVSAAQNLKDSIPALPSDIPWDAILRAAKWHDTGKAHPAFQHTLRQSLAIDSNEEILAKSGKRGRVEYTMPDGTKRVGFRHELVSALLWLAHNRQAEHKSLIAFLIAAHHGKVRASLRSMPNEVRPNDETVRFARGVWDGDIVPASDLGDGLCLPVTLLSLALMELGNQEEEPSWLSRVMELREEFGPFRLSFLETLVRIADWIGSREGEQRHGR